MSISSDKLFKKSQNPEIRDLIAVHLNEITTQILIESEKGRNQIEYDLPNTSVGYLSVIDTQTILYSTLIRKLTSPPNNHTVHIIQKRNNKSVLRVTWMSEADKAEMAEMKKIIAAHMIREN